MPDCCNKKKKNNKYYNWIYSLILLLLIIGISVYRNANKKHYLQKIEGSTMGGITYTIKYLSPFEEETIVKNRIDSILVEFNKELSHYIPNSTLSQINKNKFIKKDLNYMYKTLSISKSIYKSSIYYFNPAIGSLIDFWGFGTKKNKAKDPKNVESSIIDSLLYLCDFNKVQFSKNHIKKDCTYIKFNFSAIAKGQAVDVLFDEVKLNGFDNVFVNVGGECRASGVNANGTSWVIGITKPNKDNNEDIPVARIKLVNSSIATSGNYRNYMQLNNNNYVGHTINPVTGYPADNELLSVSVVAPDCIEADAWATAFLAMGLEYSKRILEEQNKISAYFIYSKKGVLGSYATPAFKEIIIDELVQ